MSSWTSLGLRVALALGVGVGIWLSGLLLGRIIRRLFPEAQFVGKLIGALGAALGLLFGIMTLGFSWQGALATAGITGTILTVVVSFAAQNSLGNLISGFFLLWDKPFRVGDAVMVEGLVGLVEAMDLLSVKLRTFDNVLVRIPNTKMLEATIKTFTIYPIRRIELTVGISYSADPERAVEVIREALAKEPLFLAKPDPIVMLTEFADSSVNLKVMVWIDRRDYLSAVSRLYSAVKEALEGAGIEIPFPQVVVHRAEA